MVDEQAERHRAGDHERHRRPQSRQPAQIEIAKTQSAGTVDLTKDAQGEQEAGYGEEHVHANETAGQRALRQVIPDDADQGESLDAVQALIAVIANADTPYTTSRSLEVMLEHPLPKKHFGITKCSSRTRGGFIQVAAVICMAYAVPLSYSLTVQAKGTYEGAGRAHSA